MAGGGDSKGGRAWGLELRGRSRYASAGAARPWDGPGHTRMTAEDNGEKQTANDRGLLLGPPSC
jgi:hypothetical protein